MSSVRPCNSLTAQQGVAVPRADSAQYDILIWKIFVTVLQKNSLDGCVQVCVSVYVWLPPQSVCISADSALPNPSTLHFFTDFPPSALPSSPLLSSLPHSLPPRPLPQFVTHTISLLLTAPSNPAKKQKKSPPPPPPFTESCKQHEVVGIKQYPTLEK